MLSLIAIEGSPSVKGLADLFREDPRNAFIAVLIVGVVALFWALERAQANRVKEQKERVEKAEEMGAQMAKFNTTVAVLEKTADALMAQEARTARIDTRLGDVAAQVLKISDFVKAQEARRRAPKTAEHEP